MNFYFASYEGSAEITDDELVDILDFRLVSYYVMEQHPGYNEYLLDKFHKHYVGLIMDSGAFSAWNQDGVVIDADEYVKYCLSEPYLDKYDYFVALDKIPVNYKDAQSCKESAEESLTKYLKMRDAFRKAGVDVGRIIPVYHQGEEMSYLRKLLDMEVPYIGLSPSNEGRNKTPQKREFLDSCYDVCMKNGKPRAQFHAFGLSSMPLIREFKDLLYSADAKTWAQIAGTGHILVPFKRTDHKNASFFEKWSFTEPDVIDIGNESKRDTWWLKKDDDGEYKIHDERRREIVEYIRDLGFHIGYSIIGRKSNQEILGDWEFVLKDTHKREYEKHGLKKGDSPYVWTEDFDLRKWGFEDAEPFIRYGLTHDIQWRMWCNVFATVHLSRTLSPDYGKEPEWTAKDEETRNIVSQKIRERYLARKKAKSGEMENFGF